jgi:hypothetical protein
VTLPNFQLGKPYSADLASLTAVKGGVTPYTFSLSSGSLPIGLSLSSAGVVAGTPSAAGCFKCSFGFTVMDSSGHAQLKGGQLELADLMPLTVSNVVECKAIPEPNPFGLVSCHAPSRK